MHNALKYLLTVECWRLRDGVEVHEDSKIQINTDDGGSSRLVIRDARPSDSGLYCCVAKNKHGASKCAANLRVKGHSSILFIVLCVWVQYSWVHSYLLLLILSVSAADERLLLFWHSASVCPSVCLGCVPSVTIYWHNTLCLPYMGEGQSLRRGGPSPKCKTYIVCFLF